ncbi:MAG: ankyrin repeat domain-containing protein [Rickettsiales bacterium]
MSDSTELLDSEISDNDLFDSTKLLEAVQHDSPEVIKTYLEKNLFTDFVDDEENSLIHHAIIKKNRKSLMMLLEHGINPNQLNSEHITPLHLAINNKDLKSVKILLRFGADKDIVDNKNRSALDLARENHFFEFIEIADKIKKVNVSDKQSFINYDAFVQELSDLLQKQPEQLNTDPMLDSIIKMADIHLQIPESELSSHLKSIKKNLKLLTHKIFDNLSNVQNLSKTESLKILRKFLSILNSILINNLAHTNGMEHTHKLSKVETILEDKIIQSATDVSDYTVSNCETPKNKLIKPSLTQQALPHKSLKDILENRIKHANKLSPYHFLDFNNEKLICRQVNRDMCFIDKLTIKTHYPINTKETDAIIASLESDADKKSLESAKKAVEDSRNILLLSKSKKFDEYIRPGKTHNIHLVYFCKSNDCFENQLDRLSRISLSTGCTVHSFNYPGINHSTGVVDEKKDMIYAGLSTINRLISEGICLDRIILLSDSESYSIVKNVARQFLLKDYQISRFGVIDLSLEHNSRKFKPTSVRKLLLYFNPNNVDLALSKDNTKSEKFMSNFNTEIFYTTPPDFFKGSSKCYSILNLLKRFMIQNQTFLKKNHESQNPSKISTKFDVIVGEIQS